MGHHTVVNVPTVLESSITEEQLCTDHTDSGILRKSDHLID
jgi:hypothetical protein